jgi:hypothetical protein
MFVPFSTTIANDPIVNGTNLVIETPPDYAPMAVAGATLAVGTPENQWVITFSQPVSVPISTRLRFRGVRLNIPASGVVFPGAIEAHYNVSPADAMRFIQNPPRVAALVPTIGVSFPEPFAFLLSCTRQALSRRVVLSELFSAAFTSQAQEARFSPTPAPTNPTRIEVQLRNVPGGLTLAPPQSADLRGGTSEDPPRLVLNSALSQMNRLTSTTTRDILLTYDITGTPDLTSIEGTPFADESGQGFDFLFTTTGSPAAQGLGTVEMQVRLAPVSTTAERARLGDPADAPRRVVPRFLDPFIPNPAGQLLTVAPCACNLKFPYVTNKDGLDTRIVITNTTRDPYGTPEQSGTVALHFYGEDAPKPPRLDLPAIPPGGIFTGYLSKLAPDFQGYIIAIASFQFCDGFAFIADNEFTNVSHGYMALVIPDPLQLGGRVPGFVARGNITIAGASGTIIIQDALGERLLQ